MSTDDVDNIARKFKALAPFMNERLRRRWAATEAVLLGYGGTQCVHEATGIARHTIRAAIRELDGTVESAPEGRQRRVGGGRKRVEVDQPGLRAALDVLLEPATRGDPTCPLRWVSKSQKRLSDELKAQGFDVSPNTVSRMLKEMGYSLQATSKQTEGTQHPDRNAQFQYIHDAVQTAQAEGSPTISVDAKKKELIGDFAQKGREYQPKGQPERVRTHDFVDPELGRAAPYGAYDIQHNEAWVSVGISADTSAFAVESIRTWWHEMGASRYGAQESLTIIADGGGSNGSRVRAWKYELQALADELDLAITVHHLPPGTSKWNKIEHRLFSHITGNWRGRPLLDLATVVQLIANTTTATGLRVRAQEDTRTYATGVRITDDQMASINHWPHEFHPEWNYTVCPRSWERFESEGAL